MTHAALTDAVRASELLPDRGCDRHNSYRLSRGTNARPTTQRADKSAGEMAQASPPSDRVIEWPPESTRGETRSAGRDGNLPAPTRTCTCGHLAGDHSDGRNRSLTPAQLGLCLVTGCACREYRAAESCGCPVINGEVSEQASCPVHGWGEHPVMRTVPGTPRHV